jgi:hypothetical protein
MWRGSRGPGAIFKNGGVPLLHLLQPLQLEKL